MSDHFQAIGKVFIETYFGGGQEAMDESWGAVAPLNQTVVVAFQGRRQVATGERQVQYVIDALAQFVLQHRIGSKQILDLEEKVNDAGQSVSRSKVLLFVPFKHERRRFVALFLQGFGISPSRFDHRSGDGSNQVVVHPPLDKLLDEEKRVQAACPAIEQLIRKITLGV